jgi:phosphoketolase
MQARHCAETPSPDMTSRSKKADVIRVYLPPDANTLLVVTDQVLRSRNFVNVIVAGKQPQQVWLTMDQAIKHCASESASGNGRAAITVRSPTS